MVLLIQMLKVFLVQRQMFGVVSGRKIGEPTTMPASKNQEIGNKSSDESQTKLNAENKVGEETNGEKKGELEGGGEGLSKERKIDQTFSNVQTSHINSTMVVKTMML